MLAVAEYERTPEGQARLEAARKKREEERRRREARGHRQRHPNSREMWYNVVHTATHINESLAVLGVRFPVQMRLKP